MDLRNTRTIILNQGDANEKREEIRQYFHATYSLDEQLYETLASESAFYLRPEPLRHPLIFYLGHTAAFYMNKLIVAKVHKQIDSISSFGSMFVDQRRHVWDHSMLCDDGGPALPEAMHCAHKRVRLSTNNSHDASGDADPLEQSVLGYPDGHRAPENSPRDLVGHHSPPSDRDCPAAPVVEHLPVGGRGTG